MIDPSYFKFGTKFLYGEYCYDGCDNCPHYHEVTITGFVVEDGKLFLRLSGYGEMSIHHKRLWEMAKSGQIKNID